MGASASHSHYHIDNESPCALIFFLLPNYRLGCKRVGFIV
jgi:hypothetical protein